MRSRSVFGRSLGDHGLAQHLIAENEIDIAATRALLDVARAALDGGSLAAQETSIAKTFGAEAIGRIVDRAAQLCGGLDVSADLPVARIAREVRPFRVYDGPSEVHRFAIANRAVKAERQRLGGLTCLCWPTPPPWKGTCVRSELLSRDRSPLNSSRAGAPT